MYADDTVIYVSHKSISELEEALITVMTNIAKSSSSDSTRSPSLVRILPSRILSMPIVGPRMAE